MTVKELIEKLSELDQSRPVEYRCSCLSCGVWDSYGTEVDEVYETVNIDDDRLIVQLD